MAGSASAGTIAAGRVTVAAPGMESPWRWLSKGWTDLAAVPGISAAYGLLFVGLGAGVSLGLFAIGLSAVIPAFAACFALLGPVMALGLYEIARRRAAGEPLSLQAAFAARPVAWLQLLYVAFALMFIVLVWMRAATLLVALFVHEQYPPLDQFLAFAIQNPQGLALLVVGTVVGGFLALSAFAIGALSIPMLMRHDVDAITAMALSVRTVIRHPGPMLLWAWLIGLLVAFGLVTFFAGLLVVFPLVGYATWHAGDELVHSA